MHTWLAQTYRLAGIVVMVSTSGVTESFVLIQKLACNTALTSLPRPATTLTSVSINKSEVMHQLASREIYAELNITISGQRSGRGGQIHLPWQHILEKRHWWCECQIAKASAAFGRLHKNLWNRRGITLETKVKVVYQNKRYKDTLKVLLKAFNIRPSTHGNRLHVRELVNY